MVRAAEDSVIRGFSNRKVKDSRVEEIRADHPKAAAVLIRVVGTRKISSVTPPGIRPMAVGICMATRQKPSATVCRRVAGMGSLGSHRTTGEAAVAAWEVGARAAAVVVLGAVHERAVEGHQNLG